MNRKSKKEDREYSCEKCGKVREAKYPSFKKRFCSFKCSNQWKWDNVRKHERKIEYNCKQCDKICKKPKTYVFKEGPFCSNKCFYNSRIGKFPPWLKDFCYQKDHKVWNKGKTMDMDYRVLCKIRAENQWKGLNFREKQMKRMYKNKFNMAGVRALKLFWSKPENSWRRKKAGKILHQRFLEKVGAVPNE